MNKKTVVQFVVCVLGVIVLSIVAHAGGWAIITLSEFPDYVVAGKPLNLTFTVRQHGVTLLSGLQPSISAKSTHGMTAKASVVATNAPGQYTASLSLPEPGEWAVTIVSGFNDNSITLPNLKVI